MALTVTQRLYSTGATGYAEMVADLTHAIEWRGVAIDDEMGTTTFSLYNDSQGDSRVELTVTRMDNDAPQVAISCTNAAGRFTGGAGSSLTGRYARLAVWESGFNLALSVVAFPNTERAVYCFGVGRGTRADGKANKFVAWRIEGAYISYPGFLFIASDDTDSDEWGEVVFSYNARFTAAHPLYTPYSSYVVDDLLICAQGQDPHCGTAGFCRVNDLRYYRVGQLLIPAAE